jgi:hypothetical protein
MDKIVYKICKIHGETQYVLRADKRYRCKQCAADAVIKRRKKLKLKAVDYKGGKCEVCGYDRCVEALHFHHKDPSKKDFGISAGGFTRSWDKVKKEIDKCLLVCSNCHSEIHANQIDLHKILPYTLNYD